MKRNPKEKTEFRHNLAKQFESASTLYSFEVKDDKQDLNILAIAALAITALVLIAYFIYSENFLAAFLFLLAGFTIFVGLLERKDANQKTLRCKIKSQGFQINNTLYPYENLKSFWIFYAPPNHTELSIRSKKTLMNYIKVPLGDADPVKIRELLTEFMPEKKQEEAFVDTLARNIGL